MMIEAIILWLISCSLSFGVLGLHFLTMRKAASKPWRLRIDENYRPKIDILVPTYNELDLIRLKLLNLAKIKYPRDYIQLIIVDSNSTDGTLDIVKDFARQHPEIGIKLLIDNSGSGKSAALNLALKDCDEELVIVSDADCFWPSDILTNSLPFLSDPKVGAISGPKLLLNPKQSWVTETEENYLSSMNTIKLGESKTGSTSFFEGGFSAYKRKLLDCFDPYNTGSDDCGTVISLLDKEFRAIFVPEARFYTTFPMHWSEKLGMKVRRANQLLRLFSTYLILIFKGRIKSSRNTILPNVLTYIFGPVFLVIFLVTSVFLLFDFPYLAFLLILFFIPRIGSSILEAIQGYTVLMYSYFWVFSGKNFLRWKKPADRHLFSEETLRQLNLI